MDRLHPSLYAALDEAARLYTFISNVFVNIREGRDLEHAIFRAALDLNISWTELIGRIGRFDDNPIVARASEQSTALVQIRAPVIVFLLLWRHF